MYSACLYSSKLVIVQVLYYYKQLIYLEYIQHSTYF